MATMPGLSPLSASGAAAGGFAAVGKAVEEAHRDPRTDKMRNIAAQCADLFDKARRDKLVAVGGHQKHGLDVGVEPGVHAGHLELVLEIGNGAQTADNDAGTD